jgi:hypothetical protein
MGRFVEGTDRGQTTLFPECLEYWICEDNPVRVIDAFVARLARVRKLIQIKASSARLKVRGPPATSVRRQHDWKSIVEQFDGIR